MGKAAPTCDELDVAVVCTGTPESRHPGDQDLGSSSRALGAEGALLRQCAENKRTAGAHNPTLLSHAWG